MPYTISNEQRDALQTAALMSLDALHDALEGGDFDLVRRRRVGHEAVMRLLDDLGWDLLADQQEGDGVEITMPRGQFAVALAHLAAFPSAKDTAAQLLGEVGPPPVRPKPVTRSSDERVKVSLYREDRELMHAAVLAELERPTIAMTQTIVMGRVSWALLERARLEALWRLLDDLGWAPDDAGPHFDLTLPLDQLVCALSHLVAGRAAQALAFPDPLPDDEDADAGLRFDSDVVHSCLSVLSAVDQLSGHRRMIAVPQEG